MSFHKYLPKAYTDYLENRLLSRDPTVVKSALEDLCAKCRKGYNVYAGRRHSLEITIVGLLGTMSLYPKVQMWCINALKYVGSSVSSIPPILKHLESREKDIQILASGTASIYTLSTDPHQIIKNKTPVPRKIEYLAAAQIIPPEKIQFPPPIINIENDPVGIIKTALLLEGFGKANSNLFHPKLENIELLRALMNHHDTIVGQYCYWALVENERYGFNDISASISDIFLMPDNVRVWVYRLIASACHDTKIARDLLVECVVDKCDKARESVSKGLLEVYHPQISELMVDWLFRENVEYIKDNLLFHIAKFSERDMRYESIILSEFPKLKKGTKDTIFELLEKTQMYGKLRRLEIDNGPKLFIEGDFFMGNKVDLSGANISGANVSIAGSDSSIQQTVHLIPLENRDEVDGYIQEVEAVIESLPASEDPKMLEMLENSRANIKKYRILPSKENLNKLIENVKWVDEKYKSLKDLQLVKQVKPLSISILKLLPFIKLI